MDLSLNRWTFFETVKLAAILLFLNIVISGQSTAAAQSKTGLIDDKAPAPGSWSFVLLPDTQCYTETYPEVFVSQTQWIAKERHPRNIKFVLHLGDITQSNTHPMWQNAHRAMSVLDDANVPYLMAPGNHDIGSWGSADDRRSFFSDYFVQNAWGTTRKSRLPGESENAYLRLSVGSAKLLLIALEFAPRDAVVDWANEIVTKYPDHYAILVTHAYLYSDGSRYDHRAKGNSQKYNPYTYGVAKSKEGINDGEQLWKKLVNRHPNFVFTFNGHDTTGTRTAYLKSAGEKGNSVHQMLVNYQCEFKPKGGGGFLRILEVQPDGRSVKVRDYSPYFDQWLMDADRRYTIDLGRSINEAFHP